MITKPMVLWQPCEGINCIVHLVKRIHLSMNWAIYALCRSHKIGFVLPDNPEAVYTCIDLAHVLC